MSTANKSFLLASKGLIGPLQLFLSSTGLSTVLQEKKWTFWRVWKLN